METAKLFQKYNSTMKIMFIKIYWVLTFAYLLFWKNTHREKSSVPPWNDRRRLYKLRHKNDLKTGNGIWANRILW